MFDLERVEYQNHASVVEDIVMVDCVVGMACLRAIT